MAKFDHQALARQVAQNARSVSGNDIAATLVTASLWRGETELTAHGAVSATTGQHTGRSPKDKFIVLDELTRDDVWWDNSAAMTPAHFDALLADFLAAVSGKALYSQDLRAGADARQAFPVRVYTETAWHALFIRNLLIPVETRAGEEFAPEVTIIQLPSFRADPVRHGTRSETVIALDFTRNVVLIGGSAYAGEIKKSVFSLFNFHAPARGVLPMHCSANIGPDGRSALFFGLSGTGKTTLSTDPERRLIGDDEHGWTSDNIFNIEGGCYAKTINLSAQSEPEIFAATRTFGTVLENVVLDAKTKIPDFSDGSLTENTRAAYPLSILANIEPSGTGQTPSNVVLLTADAFGVLPAVARLTPEQASYHFLSGYTAKVAGTERGVVEPKATFSTCFGAPFMSRHPTVYGRMLAERLAASGAKCWLLNTGWFGGAYGVGKRIAIKATRQLLNAALNGELDDVEMRIDPAFGFAVPAAVAGVEPALLDPRLGWADPKAYDAQARHLVELFIGNFGKVSGPDGSLADAGPRWNEAAE